MQLVGLQSVTEHWLHAPAVRTYLTASAVCVIAIIALLLICLRLRRTSATAQRSNLHTDTSATATIEFALVAPILLFLVLALTQMMLLVTGNYYVHYAAFAATRAAIVQVPLAYDTGDPTTSEYRNQVTNEPGWPKYDAIRRAARYAVVPAAGRMANGTAPTTAYVEGMLHHFNSYGLTPPGWINNVAADQLNYAFEYTQIDIMVTTTINDNPGGTPVWRVQKLTTQEHVQWMIDNNLLPAGTPLERWTFGAHAPITIRVEHELAVTLPYIGVIFSDGTHAAATTSGVGRFSRVVVDYTLNNEGIADELPPLPPVPRMP